MQQTRGLVHFLSFDCETQAMRDQLLATLKSHGVKQGPCGKRSARLRPTLCFEEKHAQRYLTALDKACAELS